MSEDPEERPKPAARKPVAKRPIAQRPAPERSERLIRAAAKSGGANAAPEPPTGSQKRAVEMPRWFWLVLAAELTFVAIVVVDAVSGWGDTPEGCFSSVCSLGQGVGIISLVAAIVLGIVVVASFMTIAVGAAQGTRRAAREERRRRT